MSFLPRQIQSIIVPPIKCQGIKTKLVSFIAENIAWDGRGKWIEPFMGSGVVGFNIRPAKALFADSNKHIIRFYQSLQNGSVNKHMVIEKLREMGENLKRKGDKYYYEVRERFNREGNSVDFLFLNRSCFNGLMRFNSKGEYNVPFGRKPERFARAYITKIANQVDKISVLIRNHEWEFRIADWKATLAVSSEGDFIYLDPPYIGRHTDYFNTWTDKDAIELSKTASSLPCEYALSMWLENRYRRNPHIEEHWHDTQLITKEHFYHVGSTESLRNSITEALVIGNSSLVRVSA